MRPLGLALLALLSLATCSDSAGPPAGQPTDFPFGAIFTSDLDASDVSIPELAGRWTFHFQESLVGFVAHEGVDQVTFHYGVVGDELEIEDVAGDERCRGEEDTGRYRWNLAGDILEFEVVEDICARRTELLTAGPWARI